MNPTGPVGVEELRQRNTGLVLTSLRHDGPATRTELARRTGLAKATVGTIVGTLNDDSLVNEVATVTSGRGRPGRPVTLADGPVVGLGVEINVDYVATVTMDLSGQIRHSDTWPVDSTRTPLEVVVEVIADRSAAIRADGGRLVGLAAAVPGLVSADSTVVRWAPNLRWTDLDLAAALRPAVGDSVQSITVDNDANCGALAEISHGAARDVDSALYLTGTIGIGAGLIHGRTLVRGASGFAGEVGHLPLGEAAALCGCGRTGCWETSIGLRAMLSAVQMSEIGTPWETALHVAERAASEPDVAAGLAQIGSSLGRGLAALSGMVDPSAIVLGGYFVPVAPWLKPAAEEAMSAHLTFADLHLPQIRLSPLGLRSAAIGAAEQSLAGVLAGSAVVT